MEVKQYQYILLDWDGNIAKTLDVWLKCCRIVLEEHGVKSSDRQIGENFGTFEQYLEKCGIKDVDSALSQVDELVAADLLDVDLYPGALIVLESLQEKGKKLALITTSSYKQIEYALEKHSLKKLFASIVTSDDVTNLKPHPEPLMKALSELGGNKNEAIMIGDSDKDLIAANNAGIDSVLFFPPEHSRYYNFTVLTNHKPTYVIHNFHELIGIVN